MDDTFDELLADYDEKLAQGEPPVAPFTPDDPELRDRLIEAWACLELLESVFPRHPTTPASDNFGAAVYSTFFPPPATVGRFVIRNELGRGGHGVVFLAYDPILKRDVALKVPRPEILCSAEMRLRFRREAEAAARLLHPNLIPLHEAGEVGPICYLVSAYCPGPTLAEWLRSNGDSLHPDNAARLIVPLADAVVHMHSQGILHRDIKPANVILQFSSGDGGVSLGSDDSSCDPETVIPRITDFGLAHFAEEATLLTKTGAVLGTPAYMAPEQAAGNREAIGPQTDVYALGVMLYELLTRKPPFQGTNDLETLRQVTCEDPVPPRRLRSEVPRDLETVTLKCLEKERSRRYSGASELADDLRRALAGKPIRARRAPPWERGKRWVQRRPRLSMSLAMVVVTMAGLIWAGTWIAQFKAQEAKKLAALSEKTAAEEARATERSRKLAAEDYPKGTTLAWMAWSRNRDWPETQRILGTLADKVRTFDLAAFEWHYLRKIPFDTQVALAGHSHAVDPVVVSADGNFLLSSGRDRRVLLWNLGRDQPPETLALVPTTRGEYPRFSPDGREVAYFWNSESASSIVRWEVPSGKRISQWDVAVPVDCVQYSADGRDLILSLRHGKRHQLCYRPLQSLPKEPAGRYVLPEDAPVVAESFLAVRGGANLLLAVENSPQSREFTVCLADPHSGAIQTKCFALGAVLSPPKARCLEFTLSSDETWGAVVLNNDEVRWGKLESGSKGLSFRASLVLSANFSRDGKTLGVATSDMQQGTAKITLLDVETGQPQSEWNLVSTETWSLAHTPDWQTVYQGGGDARIHVSRRSGPEKLVLPGHGPSEAWGLAFSPDGNRLISCGDDWALHVWNLTTFQKERSLSGHRSLATKVAWSADGSTIVSVDFDGKAILWDGATLEPMHEFQAPRGTLRAAAISSDSTRFAFGGQFKQLWLWNRTQDGPIDIRLSPAENQIESIAFSPSGRQLFATFNECQLSTIDFDTWETRRFVLPAQSRAMAVCHKANLLAVGLANGAIQYYVLDPLQEVESHRAHSLVDLKRADVLALAFTPDGRTLASGGMDGTVRLWHVETKQELLRFENVPAQVNHLAFSPDGLILAAALHNGEIWLWCAK